MDELPPFESTTIQFITRPTATCWHTILLLWPEVYPPHTKLGNSSHTVVGGRLTQLADRLTPFVHFGRPYLASIAPTLSSNQSTSHVRYHFRHCLNTSRTTNYGNELFVTLVKYVHKPEPKGQAGLNKWACISDVVWHINPSTIQAECLGDVRHTNLRDLSGWRYIPAKNSPRRNESTCKT